MKGSKLEVPEEEIRKVALFCELEQKRRHFLEVSVFLIWCAMLGSNQRPRDYESPALTAELMALGSAHCTKIRQ